MNSFEMVSKSILKKIKINKAAIKSENTLKELHFNLFDIFD